MSIPAYFSSYRGKLSLLVVIAVLVPLFVSFVIINITIGQNLRQSYQNRLKAELQTLSLILTSEEEALSQSVSALTSDNTVQITLELKILSQLKNYLAKQQASLNLFYIDIVFEGTDQVLISTDPDTVHRNCAETTVVWENGNLLLCRTLDIIKNEVRLGAITGMISLNNSGMSANLKDLIFDDFLVWVDGEMVFSSFLTPEERYEIKRPVTGEITAVKYKGDEYILLTNELKLTGQSIAYGVLLRTQKLGVIYRRMLLVITAVLLVLFVFVFTILSRLLNNLISPVNALTEAAADIHDFRKKLPDLDFDRTDELGVLNRSFRDMRTSINNYVDEIIDKNLKLKRAYKELEEYRDKLELKVEERTAELNKALERMEQARGEAVEANAAKTDFLANMSHELRTPMHGILGFASLVIDRYDKLPKEKVVDYLGEIVSGGNRLLLLINDLLDLSKLEAGQMKFEFEPFSMSMLVQTVVQELRTVFEDKNVSANLIHPDFDDTVFMDPNKMLQVLRNLVANALKFSPEGSEITISQTRQDNTLCVTVADQGVGIPEDELNLVFDKFIQSSNTKSSSGGTGLGLSICRNIVAGHNGEIWVESPETGGAIFKVKIPIDRPAET